MRSNPERLAIRTKLLEVYAKRRDIKGFELLATQLFALTRGEGEEWAKAQELGSQIDPDNAMYRVGGTPERPMADGGEVAEPLGASTLPQSVIPVPSQFGSSTSLGDLRTRQRARHDRSRPRQPDIGAPSRPAALDVTESIPPRPVASAPAFNTTTLKMPLTANEAGASAPDHRDEPLPFDLSGISLDLDSPRADEPTTAPGDLAYDGAAGRSAGAQDGARRGVPAHRRQGRRARPVARSARDGERRDQDQGARDARPHQLRRPRARRLVSARRPP